MLLSSRGGHTDRHTTGHGITHMSKRTRKYTNAQGMSRPHQTFFYIVTPVWWSSASITLCEISGWRVNVAARRHGNTILRQSLSSCRLQRLTDDQTAGRAKVFSTHTRSHRGKVELGCFGECGPISGEQLQDLLHFTFVLQNTEHTHTDVLSSHLRLDNSKQKLFVVEVTYMGLKQARTGVESKMLVLYNNSLWQLRSDIRSTFLSLSFLSF